MKKRRYLVTAQFDVSADSMQDASEITDKLLTRVVRPYVRVLDKDSRLAYEHFADGVWRKVKVAV